MSNQPTPAKPEGMEWCHTCHTYTRWDPIPRNRKGVVACRGCGYRFPCKSRKCPHIDCMEARGQDVTGLVLP